MANLDDYVKKLQDCSQDIRKATLIGELLIGHRELSGILTGILIALSLLPCKTCCIFLLISEILSNLRSIEAPMVALDPLERIGNGISPIIVITLKLIECLIKELIKLFEEIKECLCPDKKECHNKEKCHDHEHKKKCHS